MSEPLKPDGRKVGELAGQTDWEIAQAKLALIQVLGSTDPLQYHQAMRTALIHLERAHVGVHSISEIVAAAGKRGPYHKGD